MPDPRGVAQRALVAKAGGLITPYGLPIGLQNPELDPVEFQRRERGVGSQTNGAPPKTKPAQLRSVEADCQARGRVLSAMIVKPDFTCECVVSQNNPAPECGLNPGNNRSGPVRTARRILCGVSAITEICLPVRADRLKDISVTR